MGIGMAFTHAQGYKETRCPNQQNAWTLTLSRRWTHSDMHLMIIVVVI
jgi:hypothetical protein